MYLAKGFVFHDIDGKIQPCPFGGIPAQNYEEVYEIMKDMKIEHYMFILVPNKEVK